MLQLAFDFQTHVFPVVQPYDGSVPVHPIPAKRVAAPTEGAEATHRVVKQDGTPGQPVRSLTKQFPKTSKGRSDDES